MNVLLIHGVNTNEDAVPDPYSLWTIAIKNGLAAAGYHGDVIASEVEYNEIFVKHSDNPGVYAAAAAELVFSVLKHSVTHPFGMDALAAQPGLGWGDAVRWSAGMVAQLIVEGDLRAECRDRLVQRIEATKPDVIFAHSLGTLICYDLFVNDPRGQEIFKNGTLVTFGSQIANPFAADKLWEKGVRAINVSQWYNLYNPHDPIFVAPISLVAPNFHQFTLTFGGAFLDGNAHDVTTGAGHPGYLDDPSDNSTLWPALAGGTTAKLFASNIRILAQVPQLVVTPKPQLTGTSMTLSNPATPAADGLPANPVQNR